MIQIEAIYQNGVLKPLGETGLRENERVRITIEPVARPDLLRWLQSVQKHREEFVAKHGYLAESTPDIAEDRLRDI
jgi:predicted DNA-binding antitoxin AbrB/MazE fold protein